MVWEHCGYKYLPSGKLLPGSKWHFSNWELYTFNTHFGGYMSIIIICFNPNHVLYTIRISWKSTHFIEIFFLFRLVLRNIKPSAALAMYIEVEVTWGQFELDQKFVLIFVWYCFIQTCKCWNGRSNIVKKKKLYNHWSTR